ncbi:MAG: MFS transporter [Anaerolineae bacterium]|nr:MFS transporter [Anaerolineae bacterium]
MNPLSTFRESFSPLRFRSFRIYIGGQAVSLIGTWIQVTAQGWLVWQLTGSEAANGMVQALSALPILLLGPWAGVWAERLDRRKLLIGTQIGLMALAFILALLVQTGSVQIWHVFVLSFALGVITALDLPAQQAFLGDLSGMGEVRKAVNLNATVLQISRMVGPAIAGFILASQGLAPTFWINGLSFLAVIASLVVLQSNQVRRHTGQVHPLGEIWEALGYLRAHPRMQDLFIFATMVVLLVISVIMSQLPAVAEKLLGGDAQTFGLLQSASGAGALISVVIVIPIYQSLKRSGLAFTAATLWMGFWLLVFGLSRSLPLSVISLFLGSMGAPTVIATALGLLQVMSPPEMRARLLSLFTMISFGLQTVAVLVVGAMAENLGIATAIEINAVLLMIGAALMFLLRKGLREWQLTTPSVPVPAATEMVTH